MMSTNATAVHLRGLGVGDAAREAITTPDGVCISDRLNSSKSTSE